MEPNVPTKTSGRNVKITTQNEPKKMKKKRKNHNHRECIFELLGKCRRYNCPYIHKNGKTRIPCSNENSCKYDIKCVYLHAVVSKI